MQPNEIPQLDLFKSRAGEPVSFCALFSNPDHRRTVIRAGRKSIRNAFTPAIVLTIALLPLCALADENGSGYWLNEGRDLYTLLS